MEVGQTASLCLYLLSCAAGLKGARTEMMSPAVWHAELEGRISEAGCGGIEEGRELEHSRFENAPGVKRSETEAATPLSPVSPQFTCSVRLRLQA